MDFFPISFGARLNLICKKGRWEAMMLCFSVGLGDGLIKGGLAAPSIRTVYRTQGEFLV